MSLLSRFRKTVLPSNSRSKKVDDDVSQYNYRRSTKSFNEKSVKPRNSHLLIKSIDNNNYNDGQKKSLRNNGRSNPTTNKSKENKAANKLSAAATLSRSNTFTLEDEANLRNGTYPRHHKKGKLPNSGHYRDESNARDEYDDSNGK